jgi:tyrosine-specific transport protein
MRLSKTRVMYYTSLINLELNLQAGEGLALGALGRIFSGRIAELAGIVSLKLLSYSLLAVFLYGGSSILQKLYHNHHIELFSIITYSALITVGFLFLPIKWLDYFNRCLFAVLLIVVLILISGLITKIEWSDLPWFSNEYTDISVWQALIPIVFTSFGFQVIFHILTNYCNKNVIILKKAFLWGSFIPAIVYIIWTCSVISVVHYHDPHFYQHMIMGKAEIGDLIQTLCGVAQWQCVQLLVWWISLLAIITSIIGVGIGLCDALRGLLSKIIRNSLACRIVAVVMTVLPPYLVAILVPNAFIVVLGFAGMILAVIAILLPAYLLRQARIQKLHYSELNRKWLTQFSVVAAFIIIGCEIFNIFCK